MRKLTFTCLLLLVSLSTFAEEEKDEETVDLRMEIVLISSVHPDAEFKSSSLLCEKDGTHFHVSRSMLDKKKIIEAPNGIKLLLPYNKGQCYEASKTKWPKEIL